MMAGWSIPEERVAKVLGIDPKTLRKHFTEELEVGLVKLEAQLAQNLLRIAQGYDRQSLIATIFTLASRLGRVERPPPARQRPLGKKEAMQDAAHRAVSSSFRFAPPRPPPYYREGRAPDEDLN
jgi:hypothetical protein